MVDFVTGCVGEADHVSSIGLVEIVVCRTVSIMPLNHLRRFSFDIDADTLEEAEHRFALLFATQVVEVAHEGHVPE